MNNCCKKLSEELVKALNIRSESDILSNKERGDTSKESDIKRSDDENCNDWFLND